MSSLFSRYCYPDLGGMLCGFFPKHKRTLLVGKGPTLRLYAGALIKRCFNAVLATHKGLIMSEINILVLDALAHDSVHVVSLDTWLISLAHNYISDLISMCRKKTT